MSIMRDVDTAKCPLVNNYVKKWGFAKSYDVANRLGKTVYN